MEFALIVLVYAIVAAIGFARRDKTSMALTVSLCLTCANAIVTRGTRGEEWVACSYGGALRAVNLRSARVPGITRFQAPTSS